MTAVALLIAFTSACQLPFGGSDDAQPTASQAQRELFRVAHAVVDEVAGAGVWFNDEPGGPLIPCRLRDGAGRDGARYTFYLDLEARASTENTAAASSKLRQLGFEVDPVDDGATAAGRTLVEFGDDMLDGRLSRNSDDSIVLTAETKCLPGRTDPAPGDT